jgi:hypothetical protein
MTELKVRCQAGFGGASFVMPLQIHLRLAVAIADALPQGVDNSFQAGVGSLLKGQCGSSAPRSA